MKYRELRKKYPRFVYEKYSWQVSRKNLEIFFTFKIKPNISFTPKIVIENINRARIRRVGDEVLNNLIFHLGLVELISYWKATCSPKIEIQAGPLNKEQIKWWKNLIINGMGQFFYENKIDFRPTKFLQILPPNVARSFLVTFYRRKLNDKILVPIGGGKDSVVALEILKQNPSTGKKRKINCLSLNPTPAAKKIMDIGECKKPITVRRKIDRKLLALNQRGFLNGHTPFSAYLAFLSCLLGVIFDFKFITFSNERSSDEGNVKYLEKIINHQYSKTFDFERKFRNYSKRYLAKELEYFSFLRPLYEIQIAKLFSRHLKYFPVFMSCNVAYQTNSGRKKPTGQWCGACPKCLFIFASLYPFVESKKLIKTLGGNLFENKRLLPLMLQLLGEKGFKPFECVGTKKESRVAFYLSWKKASKEGEEPYLLNYFKKKLLSKYKKIEEDSKKIISSWNTKHNLPKSFEKALKNNLSRPLFFI